jgi:hypothetical protein
MAGRKGRSGGHNKLSADELLKRGTWRIYRHGPRPASVPLRGSGPPSPTDPLPPPASLVAGLSAPGLAVVEQCWRRYRWAVAGLVLLRELGFTITWLEQHRGEKGEREAQRLLVQLVAALDLET